MDLMDTILSVILLMLYVIVAGWTAGFHAIRTSGGLSVYAASDRLSAHALGMSAFSSELGIWLMLAPFLSIFRSLGCSRRTARLRRRRRFFSVLVSAGAENEDIQRDIGAVAHGSVLPGPPAQRRYRVRAHKLRRVRSGVLPAVCRGGHKHGSPRSCSGCSASITRCA